jgi:hypothetical protein
VSEEYEKFQARGRRRKFWLRFFCNARFRKGAVNATLYQMGYKQALKDVENGHVAEHRERCLGSGSGIYQSSGSSSNK